MDWETGWRRHLGWASPLQSDWASACRSNWVSTLGLLSPSDVEKASASPRPTKWGWGLRSRPESSPG